VQKAPLDGKKLDKKIIMGSVLSISDQKITETNLFELLAEHQLLPQLVRELIVDQAIADIECTEEEKNLARQQFIQQNKITSEEQIDSWASSQWMTREQLEKRILRALKVEKFKEERWGSTLESYFLERKGNLDQVVYSLIRTQDAGIAQELYFRIQEDETSFAEIAKEFSQGAEAKTGGIVGPVELNVPHAKIAKMLTSIQPGQLLPPTKIENWIVIVRLEQFISAQLNPPMRQRLLQEKFNQWLTDKMQNHVSFSNTESLSLSK
jgi:parvulin-like peptidyl-prolyl isomerase